MAKTQKEEVVPSTIEMCLDLHRDIDDYCISGKTVYIILKEGKDTIDVRLSLRGFTSHTLKFI